MGRGPPQAMVTSLGGTSAKYFKRIPIPGEATKLVAFFIA
jgi:hypothetical protein